MYIDVGVIIFRCFYYFQTILHNNTHCVFHIMPRRYLRDLGSRKYCDYTKEKLDEALADINSNKLTQVAAARIYNIPLSTLKNKLNNRHSKKVGGRANLLNSRGCVYKLHNNHVKLWFSNRCF